MSWLQKSKFEFRKRKKSIIVNLAISKCMFLILILFFLLPLISLHFKKGGTYIFFLNLFFRRLCDELYKFALDIILIVYCWINSNIKCVTYWHHQMFTNLNGIVIKNNIKGPIKGQFNFCLMIYLHVVIDLLCY